MTTTDQAMAAIDRIIAALTDQVFDRAEVDDNGVAKTIPSEAIPLLQRSVSGELDRVASVSFQHAGLLRAIGVEIDEALLAAIEAKLVLQVAA